MPKSITIDFGLGKPPIEKQLRQQGIHNLKSVNVFQKDSDAITRLYVRGVIHESVATAARIKLLKMIHEVVESGRKKVPA